MPLVAQHQFVAILRQLGWRAPLIGTWTEGGTGTATGPAGETVRWTAPPGSDDRNEKGTWSSVWLDDVTHPSVAMAAEAAGLGDDVLAGPLGPQGRYRRRGLEIWLERVGLTGDVRVQEPWMVVAGHGIHLASGAVRAPDGTLRERDPGLAPLTLTGDPGLGRILAEALRLRDGALTR